MRTVSIAVLVPREQGTW